MHEFDHLADLLGTLLVCKQLGHGLTRQGGAIRSQVLDESHGASLDLLLLATLPGANGLYVALRAPLCRGTPILAAVLRLALAPVTLRHRIPRNPASPGEKRRYQMIPAASTQCSGCNLPVPTANASEHHRNAVRLAKKALDFWYKY